MKTSAYDDRPDNADADNTPPAGAASDVDDDDDDDDDDDEDEDDSAWAASIFMYGLGGSLAHHSRSGRKALCANW